MNKEELQPLTGFRDQLGSLKSEVAEKLRLIFKRYGFQQLETPSLEKKSLLISKYGEEAQKLLYLFKDKGNREVGLRYDLTLPLARFVGNNWRNLALPFKRFEIGPVWRAEKPQKGRFREFYQADVDIVGSSCLGSEIELLEVISAFAREFNIKLKCLINDRRLINKVFTELDIEKEKVKKILRILDKKEKVSKEQLRGELAKLLTDRQEKIVNELFFCEGEEAFKNFQQFLGDGESLKLLEELARSNISDLKIVFAPYMVRGLDYYTGTIIEAVINDYQGGSIAAGGRYDNLIEDLAGVKIPAVGVSFGIDRIVDYLEEKQEPQMGTVFVLNLPEMEEEVRQWVEQLRSQDKQVELYLDSADSLGRQIKYADKKGYEQIYIPFEEDWREGNIVQKNLASSKQIKIKRSVLEK